MAERGDPPTLYEWAGGRDGIRAPDRCLLRPGRGRRADLAALSRGRQPRAPRRTSSLWWSEVFGGPDGLHREAGRLPPDGRQAPRPRDHPGAAPAVRDPDEPGRRRRRPAGDPEFRSAFMAYVEWGTRLALHNSQPGAATSRRRRRCRAGAGAWPRRISHEWRRGWSRRPAALPVGARARPTTSTTTTTSGVVRCTASAELFERLTLEAFQSGLSWLTILRKRENFRRAFDGFDIEKVAEYGERGRRAPAGRRGDHPQPAARSRRRSPTPRRRGSCTRRARRWTS